MAKNKPMTVEELEARNAEFLTKRAAIVAQIRELEAKLANPGLDPAMGFEAVVAALADTDKELNAARALLPIMDQQIKEIGLALQAAKAAERAAKVEALRPEEDAAKVRLVETVAAHLEALEAAHEVWGKIQQQAGHTTLREFWPRDYRMQLRKQVSRMRTYLGDMAADLPKAPLNW
jgi:chromosome segregation ATPase